MTFNREQFVADAIALTSLNIPWKHQGRNPLIGMDCIGIPRYLYEKQGLTLPQELLEAWSAYHTNPDGWKMLRLMRKYFIEITVDQLQPADLLQMLIQKNPKHMGVFVGNGLVVEAFQSQDRYVCRAMIRRLRAMKRIEACFRIPD